MISKNLSFFENISEVILAIGFSNISCFNPFPETFSYILLG
jgi:hypothetical protein